jgi:hypothetical protein
LYFSFIEKKGQAMKETLPGESMKKALGRACIFSTRTFYWRVPVGRKQRRPGQLLKRLCWKVNEQPNLSCFISLSEGSSSTQPSTHLLNNQFFQ